MNEPDRSQVSVVAAAVHPGREREFLAVIGDLHTLVTARGYGREQLLQDASDLCLYYDICTWTDPGAADRCQDDPEVRAVWQRLRRTARITHLVGVAWPVEARAALAGQTRLDRRVRRQRRADDERRSADRRKRQLAPPQSVERRADERRQGERRLPGSRRFVSRGEVLPTTQASADALLDAARAARNHAHAEYSKFRVGAALETADGTIIKGCNVENATYGLTICAERVAVFKAISEGHRSFTRVAVVADTADPTPPCGACRQILWEFGGDLDIILGDLVEEKSRFRLSQLLPHPFDGRLLT